MLKKIWSTIQNYGRQEKGESLRTASKNLGVPKSTIHYQEQRKLKREEKTGTTYWETKTGQTYLKRMIISTIYTFGIKGGVGCDRISEHFKHLQIDSVAAVSPRSIGRMVKEIEEAILLYKSLQEKGLEELVKEEGVNLKAVLGVDETWVDELLLICQELSSGYLFLKK